MFIDKVAIEARAGKGGNGLASFRREKFIPRGGPDGGDGGNGGSVVITAREKVPHLANIRNHAVFVATNGKPGGKSRKYGRGGDDCDIEVPVGTTVYDAETGEVLADLIAHNQKVVVAEGGKGGRGNVHFATPTNRTPQRSDPGSDGQERGVLLELTLVADSALVGLSSVGKTELHKAMTGSRQQQTGFAFSTRQPSLGVCSRNLYTRFSILDLPSLMSGSSEGQGLGNRFLRHLTRTRAIVLVLDPMLPQKPQDQIKIIEEEISAFDADFSDKKRLYVISKIDAPGVELPKRGLIKYNIIKTSAKTGEGVEELAAALIKVLGIE